MFGVVLWSCETGKAVIWCEDQGDLAYLDTSEEMTEGPQVVSPGDLVKFELHADTQIRRVRSACIVAADHSPTLANDLQHAVTNCGRRDPGPTPGKGQVVAFRNATTKKRDRVRDEAELSLLHG